MEVIASVLNNYPAYREHKLKDRFFKHADIETLIQKKKGFSINEAGKSVEDRSIYLLAKGTGPVRVFLWSQMHGDEATGTMALFDLFNFLEADNAHNEIRENLLKHCTLYFSTMINTDGLEWKRPKWKGLGAKYFYFGAWSATRLYNRIITDADAMQRVYLEKFNAPSTVIAYGAPAFKPASKHLVEEFGLQEHDYYLIIGRLIPDNNNHS